MRKEWYGEIDKRERERERELRREQERRTCGSGWSEIYDKLSLLPENKEAIFLSSCSAIRIITTHTGLLNKNFSNISRKKNKHKKNKQTLPTQKTGKQKGIKRNKYAAIWRNSMCQVTSSSLQKC